MNFFESQDRAHKNTAWLVFLFVLAVAALIVITNLLVMVVFANVDGQQVREGGGQLRSWDWQTFAAVSVGVSAVVLAGSLYKIMTLSSGGKVVAEALGGQLVPTNTGDLKQRKLLNVVEEMAIASGTPAPPVYVLADEPGINAFAAGFSPRDAIIGVTQGAIDHLSRDQLQGVIAHEFSHIFNGDMRLNIRLMGVLNGILIIGTIGYYILYSVSYSRRGRSGDKAAGLLALAIGLMAIGFAGTFFGGLIKAAVSRQREYLADASAVQFTRNPDGIAGALKRIGGLEYGSRVENPGAPEVSHAFFAQGVSGFMQSLSATHPPLAKRILRIDPQWDGQYDFTDQADASPEAGETRSEETMTREELAKKVATVITGATMADVANTIDQVGNPDEETINHARTLLSELPAGIKETARDPYGARAIIYAMFLGKGREIRGRQLKRLESYADPDVYALTLKLAGDMDGLDIGYRLPVLDIAIPALKQLSSDQYEGFRANVVALIEMDARVELMEWSLQKILFHHLDGQFFKPAPVRARYAHPARLGKEIRLVFSVLASAGQQNPGEAEKAFMAAVATLGLSGLTPLPEAEISLSDLDGALERLAALKPLMKPRILKACAVCIAADQKILPEEVELLRAFSDVLDCPMPPVV